MNWLKNWFCITSPSVTRNLISPLVAGKSREVIGVTGGSHTGCGGPGNHPDVYLPCSCPRSGRGVGGAVGVKGRMCVEGFDLFWLSPKQLGEPKASCYYYDFFSNLWFFPHYASLSITHLCPVHATLILFLIIEVCASNWETLLVFWIHPGRLIPSKRALLSAGIWMVRLKLPLMARMPNYALCDNCFVLLCKLHDWKPQRFDIISDCVCLVSEILNTLYLLQFIF